MLLDYDLDIWLWKFIKSLLKLCKKDAIKIIKKWNIYKIDIKDTNMTEEISDLIIFFDTLYQKDNFLDDLDIKTSNKDNDKLILFLRDINNEDITLLKEIYELVTKKKFIIEKKTLKDNFYDFLKQIWEIEFDINDYIKKNIIFIQNEILSEKEKQILKLIIKLWIILWLYHNKLRKSDFKYIVNINNFFSKKWMNYLNIELESSLPNYLIKFIYKYLEFIKSYQKFWKTKFFIVLSKVAFKLNLQQIEDEISSEIKQTNKNNDSSFTRKDGVNDNTDIDIDNILQELNTLKS